MTANSSPYQGSLEEVLSSLPIAERIEVLDVPRSTTCVVAIAGFERRCVSATEAMHSLGWSAERSLCIRYSNSEMEVPNSKYFDDVCDELSAVSSPNAPEILEHDDHCIETDFGEQLLNKLKAMGVDCDSDTTHVVFDITVGSSRLLLEGLHALLTTNAKLTLTYTEVGRYRPTFEEYRSHLEEQQVRHIEPPEFLTHGVDRVEVLKAIPGRNADSRPSYLVVFPAFAFSRISAVIDEMSPSRVQWMFGIPHLVENRWRIDAQREYHESLIERQHRHCYVSTFDYRETLQALERIYLRRRANYGVIVASLGSKMQKVGQVLFHILRPEAAAVVSIPRAWNDDRYSDETPRAVYVLDLGNCGDLREALWRTRQLRI